MSISDDFGSVDVGALGGFDDPAEETALDKIEYTGNAEVDSKRELNAFEQAAKAALQREKDARADMFDTEYFACICFQSRDQKEAFLSALGLLEHGDKYLDGYEVAEKVGVVLPPAGKVVRENRIHSGWNEFLM